MRRARLRLAKGETLPTDDLVNLTKETVMSDFKPSPEFEALVDKHVDKDRVKQLHPGTWTAEDQAKARSGGATPMISASWPSTMNFVPRFKSRPPRWFCQ